MMICYEKPKKKKKKDLQGTSLQNAKSLYFDQTLVPQCKQISLILAKNGSEDFIFLVGGKVSLNSELEISFSHFCFPT
jgi:hypothetical protein